MDLQYFIGIDVSKESLNWAICCSNKIVLELASGNDIKSITKTVVSIQRQLKFKIDSAVFCMEHTARAAPGYLPYAISKISPKSKSIYLTVRRSGWNQVAKPRRRTAKYSMGDTRGKNDVIDAQRIARYSYKNRDEIKLWVPPRAIVDQLDNLLDVRDRLH